MEVAVSTRNQWLFVAVLAALFIAGIFFCVVVWQSTHSMPRYGYVIMSGAITLALVAGCGLIALMYYSQRKGYDEPARSERTPRE
jgi:hypothetical protein